MLQVQTIFFIFIFAYTANALQCIDENGGSVDWAIAYKLPQSERSKNELIKNGVAYVYMSSATPHWTLSKYRIAEEKSILAEHLEMFLDDMDPSIHLVYNDILPSGYKNETVGHTRGIILANAEGGIWGIHVLPGFPAIGEEALLFCCISLDLENLDKVGKALTYRQPNILDNAQMNPNMEAKLPMLASLMRGERSAKEPWYEIDTLESRDGMKIVSYSKSREFGGDLYKDLIASQSGIDFWVRSEISEKDGLESNCENPRVENIETVFMKAAGITITDAEDESKWAVSKPQSNEGWFCTGDMDRNESEEHRGGGATCLSNSVIVEKFHEIITSVEQCP